MCKVAESPKKLHILAADDTGTAEKNIINKDLGILDDFGILVEYNGSGTKMIRFHIYCFIPHKEIRQYMFLVMETKRSGKRLWAVSTAAYILMRLIQQILICQRSINAL